MESKNRLLQKIWMILTILYMAVIFYLSNMSKVPEIVPEAISDYLLHFFEYTILGMLLTLAHGTKQVKTLKEFTIGLITTPDLNYPIFVGVAFGISDEIHQAFVAGRVFSVGDMFFDSLGCIFGSLIIHLFFKHSLKK